LKRETLIYCLLIAVFAALPLFGLSSYNLHVLIMIGIFLILSQSLNLMMGYVGLLSLACSGFFGVGAYISALLSLHYKLTFIPSFFAAGLGSAALAACVGIPFLRLSRHSFVVGTLAFLLMCDLVSRNWTSVTRGPMGLPGIPSPRIVLPFLPSIAVSSKEAHYYFILVLSCLVLYGFAKLTTSRLGRAFTAVRDDEVLAKAMGIHTFKIKWIAFVLSAFLAAVAGSYYAHYITFVDPLIFDLYYLEVALVTVIVGGAGTVWGVAVGAFLFTILPEFLRVVGGLRLLVYGIILFLSILLIPEGIGGAIRNRLRRRRVAEG
jgi:branched-chain amino acid transport system permease protein